MSVPSDRFDSATRAFLADQSRDANAVLLAFVVSDQREAAALESVLHEHGVAIAGRVEHVFAVRLRSAQLRQLESAGGVARVEGWANPDTQRGADPGDLRAVAEATVPGDRAIAAFVRLASDPDARASELMELVGLRPFPGQAGRVRAGTLSIQAVHDALAIPVVEAVKLCVAMTRADADAPHQIHPGTPDLRKVNASTRMALAEASGNPEVGVFIEFGSQPKPAEQRQMDAVGLRIISGQGPIKTGRVPLQSITALTALSCIRAIEAAQPLYPESKHGTSESDGPRDLNH